MYQEDSCSSHRSYLCDNMMGAGILPEASRPGILDSDVVSHQSLLPRPAHTYVTSKMSLVILADVQVR
jgi:hypothetical protein